MRNYTETTRVQIPAVIQYLRLGYQYQSKRDAVPDKETRIYRDRFAQALARINNRVFSEEEITQLLIEINRIIKNNDLGSEFYDWLVHPRSRPKLIDFENIENNDFAVVTELTFGRDGHGDERQGSFRPDIVVLINGLPLAFLEVKPENNTGGIQAEFNRMLNQRLENPDWRKYFNLFQFITFSNNMAYDESDAAADVETVRAGSFYTTPNNFRTTFSYFRDEETLNNNLVSVSDETIRYILKDNEYRDVDSILMMPEFQTAIDVNNPNGWCNKFVTSFFSKERLMFFLRYGLVYVDGTVPEKHVMRYPQFFASQALLKRLDEGGTHGIVWHTQGSGKTELTVYLNRILKDYYAKKGINTRFYYVVDRLDLLEQTRGRLSSRRISVTTIKDKKAFADDLKRPFSVNTDYEEECVVVNIHKFESDVPQVKNDYATNFIRVFFIDEAHRSYKQNGTYFQNLLLMDDNAVFIALTGTPLLSKKERSSLKFGNYIHKYFYDRSIIDGYTLRIKREIIETEAKTYFRENFTVEDPDTGKHVIRDSKAYNAAVGDYIAKDFKGFRLQQLDKSIGGLIVCSSNEQAKQIHEWFKANSDLRTGLVISGDETYSKDNIDVQRSFEKSTDEYALLVVHNMLTTGFDVAHLKKMYLLKNASRQTLLQTISRVNRPYRAPKTKKAYHYGYIVDFVDIEKEYDRTLQEYLRELQSDTDEPVTYTGLVVDTESIHDKVGGLMEVVKVFGGLDNLAIFAANLQQYDISELYGLRRTLTEILSCRAELLMGHATEYANEIDLEKIHAAIKEVSGRISQLNLKEDPKNTLEIISDEEIVEIVYRFVKTGIVILDLKQYIEKIADVTRKIRDSLGKVKNQRDIRIIKLNEALAEIFDKLNIKTVEDAETAYNELELIFSGIEHINTENETLANKYGGNYAFVKTYQDCIEQHPDVNPELIEGLVTRAYQCMSKVSETNPHQLDTRNGFVNVLSSRFADYIFDKPELISIKADKWYRDDVLKQAYDNLRLFA